MDFTNSRIIYVTLIIHFKSFENDKVSSVSIDLTKKSVVNDNYFQISSGDIIIINPNYSRVKNAGIIGNSGTLLSRGSFLLSSIIVLQR